MRTNILSCILWTFTYKVPDYADNACEHIHHFDTLHNQRPV